MDHELRSRGLEPRTETDRRLSTRTTILSLSHVGTDLLVGAYGAVLPSIQARHHLSPAGVGLLVATLAVASSFGQPFAGRLIGRIGSRRAAVAGAVAASLLLSAAPIAPSTNGVFVLTALGGIGSAVYHPAAAAMARRSAAGDGRMGMSVFAAGGTLGFAVGPVLATTVVAGRGLGWMPLLAVPTLVGTIALARTFDDDKPADVRRSAAPVHRLVGSLHTHLGAATAAFVASTAFTAAVPLWLVAESHGGAVGWVLATYSLAVAGGGLAGTVLARTVHPALLVPGAALLAAFAVLAVVGLPPTSVRWYLAVLAVGGLGHLGTPLLVADGQDRVPSDLGTVSGLLMGLPMGLAGVAYLPLAALASPARLDLVILAGGAALLPGALAAHFALRSASVSRCEPFARSLVGAQPRCGPSICPTC